MPDPESPAYDYGIARKATAAGETIVPHRERMTQFEAEDWLRSWRETVEDRYEGDGAKDIFVMVRRPMGPWEIAEPPGEQS